MARFTPPVAEPTTAQNLAGIAAALISAATLTINDGLSKLASESLPTSQIIVLRGVVAVLIILAVAPLLGEAGLSNLRWMRKPSVSFRVFSEVGATILYLTALFHLPIASATMIQQTLPLAVTAGAALFLGAKVGWRQWVAIAIGFLGVAIILRPGPDGFNMWLFVALASIGFMTLRDLATRVMPPNVSTLAVTLLTMMATSLLGLVLAMGESWIVPTPRDLIIIAGAAAFLIFGFFFLIAALRDADVGIVAPFRYSSVLWAVAIGYVIWGDIPDGPTILGAVIVIGAGLYTVHRQRLAAKRKKAEDPAS